MYIHKDHMPLSCDFQADRHLELILSAGMDGMLGQSWEDENGAIVATGFFTYLLGKPAPDPETERLLRQACPHCAVPRSSEWRVFLQRFPHKTYIRHKMLPPGQFDAATLVHMAHTLPEGFDICTITPAMLEDGLITDGELNIPLAFGSREQYFRTGFGFAVFHGEKVVSIASSYLAYQGEVEVDISTETEYRRLGLASAACARFLLECMARNVTPSWDSQNPESVRLARKLGFTADHAYEAYVLTP